MQNIAKKRITGLANQTTIAQLVGVRPQAISLWLKNGVPPKKVIRLCGALEWQVTPHELRPDIYPNPTDALPAHREQAA